MRKTAIGAGLALVAAAVVVVTFLSGRVRETARDAGAFVGVVNDPPFHLELGGRLWRDRTLRGGDGAQDFAQVARDEPLTVRIRGSDTTRVAQVELRVDGRRQRSVEPKCAPDPCPTSLSVTFVPLLHRLLPGDHRVQVVARDSRARRSRDETGPHVSVAAFSVRTVTQVPPTVESSLAGTLPGPSITPRDAAVLERSGLQALAAERQSSGLAAALGSARVRVIYVGNLKVNGRRLGATMLVELVPPRRNVRATVPSYIPAPPRAGAPYTRQVVRMHVKTLRDVLVDVDLSNRRVIAFEPGPRSETLSWSPSKAPAPAGAADED
jgi:hypothetical protein